VDVDIGEKLIDPHDHARGAPPIGTIKPMGDTIPGYCPDTRVVEKKFKFVVNSRVIVINVYKIFFYLRKESQVMPLLY
jgi:hypothetical protein